MLLPASPPADLRALHIGGYWRRDNDMVLHMLQGLRAAGLQVEEFDTDRHREALDTDGRKYDRGTSGPTWLRWEALEPVVSKLQPHLIVCNAGGLAFRPSVAALLRARHCLLGIALSDPDVFAVTTRHIAGGFDAFLTNAPECVSDYAGLGPRAAVLPVATNPEFFRPLPPREELRCEVLVLGRAHPDRVAPVRALADHFDLHLYGEGWSEHGLAARRPIFGETVLEALASAVTTVIFHRTAGGHALLKVGLFDFTAAGALVVTNHSPLVAPHFRYGHEILGFDDEASLLACIRRCLDDPALAARVRQAGRQRSLRDHGWSGVWLDVLPFLAGRRDRVR